MKATKFAVLGLTILTMAAVFADWISVNGKNASALLQKIPRTGMENGGPIFLFFLSLPLLAAVIGMARRFGRGMATLALVGAALSLFMALVKYNDIEAAALSAEGLGASVEAAGGFWLFFVASLAIFFTALVGLILPEKKPALPAAAGAAHNMAIRPL